MIEEFVFNDNFEQTVVLDFQNSIDCNDSDNNDSDSNIFKVS